MILETKKARDGTRTLFCPQKPVKLRKSVVGIVVTVIGIIVTLISIIQTTRENKKHKKSNCPDQR